MNSADLLKIANGCTRHEWIDGHTNVFRLSSGSWSGEFNPLEDKAQLIDVMEWLLVEGCYFNYIYDDSIELCLIDDKTTFQSDLGTLAENILNIALQVVNYEEKQ